MSIRLLVADSCRVCLRGLLSILGDTPDFAVIGTTPDGEAAVQLALSLRPDILLLGVELQSVDGLTVMTRVRHADPSIRGVFFTHRAGERWERLGHEAGAIAWVNKGVDEAVLLNTLREVHAGRHQHGLSAARLDTVTNRMAPLSPKEIVVLRQAVRGLASKDIAAIVGCAPRTVDKHLASLRHKFGVTHPRAIIPVGLVFLQHLDLLAEDARGGGDDPEPRPRP